MYGLKEKFLLNPSITYLNHGSFGVCPKSVFEVYQNWQLELEREPTDFLGRRYVPLLESARSILASYLGIAADDVVFFTNPTTAINMISRMLAHPEFNIQRGDEILTTDHEYGAMDRAWEFNCLRTGARYVRQPIPFPLADPESIVDEFLTGVNEKTKVIFISHITSPTALIFPVSKICNRARENGIITVVDGAHTPGQLPLDLSKIGADIYIGSCHKWLCAPKGASFIFARKEVQRFLDPLIISWGYESSEPGQSQFIDYHEWQGTRDQAAFLSVPAAIKFQEKHNWNNVRNYSHRLASLAQKQISDLIGSQIICLDDYFNQMVSIPLPNNTDLVNLENQLYHEFHIEVPLIHWNGHKIMRVSIQGYNNREDVLYLIDTVEQMIKDKIIIPVH